MTGAPRRLLVLANRLPYPIDDGWKTRTFHILRGLARNASVTLLTFHDGTDGDAAALQSSIDGDLRVVTAGAQPGHSPTRLLLGLLTPTPVYVWNMRSQRFTAALRRAVDEVRPEAVVAELTYMAPYLRDLPAGVMRVIDTHNIDSVVLRRYASSLPDLPRRVYAAITARKLRRFEARVFADADLVWVCSEEEERLAARIAPRAQVRTIPNGVDTQALVAPVGTLPVPNRLLFFGRMDYAPNRDAIEHFVRHILPLLRSREPDVQLHVVGAGIDDALRAVVRDVPEVRLIGRVDDLRPVLAEAAVVVVPLRMGGGTRLKILEAMSCGRPIVSTTIGAEGLHLRSGHELLLADDPADFAQAVSGVLRDAALGAALGAAARQAAIARFDWTRIQEEALASMQQIRVPESGKK